ncbi:MAG: Zn-ribbon domain-containing OB-fold protein [Dehalococcoidia bacterium]
MSDYQKPLPKPTPLTQPFWDGIRQHQVLVQRCDGCGALRHVPKPWCPECLTAACTWTSLSGEGRIYTYTVMHRAPDRAFTDDLPYVVALVEMTEGVRLISNVVGCPPEQVRVGMPVKVVYEDINDAIALFKFAPA